ncbi:MAG: MBL fold metallo-hydrolase [Clostridia bacterium]|nr:MBL fold metallo-hydrolase [Clostridia bacterium]
MDLLNKIIEFFIALLMALGISTGADDKLVSDTDTAKVAETTLTVHCIDVGQADSTYIKLPNGENMLIDAGESGDAQLVADYLDKQGVSRLDYVVGTHPHADHIGGMAYVVNNFDIGIFYMPDAYSNTKTFESLLDALEDKAVDVRQAKSGVSILKADELSIELLSPVSAEYDETNDYSAVVRIEYGDTSFLFMGDAEKLVEQELLDMGAQLQSDVLRVGHHGSSTSSSKAFIREVNPSLAVISVGKDNSYGHPHSETLSLLKERDTTILRTDKLGTVVIGSNGKDIVY